MSLVSPNVCPLMDTTVPIDLLRPFPADEMKAKEAHKDVGNVRNNQAELLNSA